MLSSSSSMSREGAGQSFSLYRLSAWEERGTQPIVLVWRGRTAVLIGEASTLVRYLRRKVARAFFLKRFIL